MIAGKPQGKSGNVCQHITYHCRLHTYAPIEFLFHYSLTAALDGCMHMAQYCVITLFYCKVKFLKTTCNPSHYICAFE